MTNRLTAVIASAVAAGLAIVLVGCGPLGQPRNERDGSPRPGTPAAATTAHSIEVDGATRDYLLYESPSAPADAPLVVMLHGGFGSAEQAANAYNWIREAREHGFVVMFPNGDGRAWNAGGGCCGAPGNDGTDDVSAIGAMVADVRSSIGIDETRIYATGMSNGAMMTYRLACDTSGLFAAYAPVAGTIMGDCDDPDPASILHIHGLLDTSVPFDGSRGDGAVKVDGAPVQQIVEAWRATDGCDAPAASGAPPVAISIAECPDDRTVELITIADAGHQWPGAESSELRDRLGGDPPSTALDATDEIWAFFAAHPRD